MTEEFESAVESVRQLEKKLAAYAPYSGEVAIARVLDLEPREYVDFTYADMLNLYERSEKIRSTVAAFKPGEKGAERAAAPAAPPPAAPTAASMEIETKLKEMTTETLKMAEEVGRKPIVLEKAQVPAKAEAPQKPYEMEIEFEQRAAAEKAPELELEIEKPGAARAEEPRPAEKRRGLEELEIERPAEKPEPKEERKVPAPVPEAGAPAVEVPVEKKVVIAAVPPALRESPDEAATRKYEQMEEQVEEMLGGAVDEVSIKKKMLELTKELFREKSVNRREQIKTQISVMKNMLVGGMAGAAGRKKKAAAVEDTRGRLLDTILSTQQAELAQTKDSIIDSYNRQIASIRKKFYDDIARVEEPAKRKAVFESFVFSVTSLVEQLPEVIRKYQDYTVRKHAAEVEKLIGSLADKDKATAARAKERAGYIRTGYAAEFAPVKGIIGRQIEALIDSAGSGVFEKAAGEREDKAMEAVAEINGTDDGTLLAYLQSKDSAFYGKYEKKQMSRAEAIARAKALMAKEKGLSDALTRKYFSGTEG